MTVVILSDENPCLVTQKNLQVGHKQFEYLIQFQLVKFVKFEVYLTHNQIYRVFQDVIKLHNE